MTTLSYSIMEEEESLRMFSPEVMIQDPNIGNANSLLPPVVFFHGSGNYSIPLDAWFVPIYKGFTFFGNNIKQEFLY